MIVNAIHTSKKINRRKYQFQIPKYGKKKVRTIFVHDDQNELGTLILNPESNSINVELRNPLVKNEISVLLDFDNFIALLSDIMNSKFNDDSFENDIYESLGYNFSIRGFEIQKKEIKIYNEKEFKFVECNNNQKIGYRFNSSNETVELSISGDIKEKYQIEIPLNPLKLMYLDLITNKSTESHLFSLETICTIIATEKRKDANKLMKKMDLEDLLFFIKSREIETNFELTAGDKKNTIISKTKPLLNLVELVFKDKINDEKVEIKLSYFELLVLFSSLLMTNFSDESFKKEIYRNIGMEFIKRGFVKDNPIYLNNSEEWKQDLDC